MAYGDVIQEKVGTTASSGASTLTVTMDSTPTEDNLLVAACTTRANTQSTPSGWSLAATVDDLTNVDNLSIFYKIAGASESTTVVFNDATSNQVMVAAVYEIEGPWESAPVDRTSTAQSASGTSHQAGTTGTLTQADEVAFFATAARFNDTDDMVSPSVDSSFTLQESGLYIGYTSDKDPSYLLPSTKTVSATTALNPEHSWTTSSDGIMSAIVTFLKAGSGGTPTDVAIATPQLEHAIPAHNYVTLSGGNLTATDAAALSITMTYGFLHPLKVYGLRLMEDTEFAMEITVSDPDGSAIDWTNYTLESRATYDSTTSYLYDFVTGNASGKLTFGLTEAQINTYNTYRGHSGTMFIHADDGTTRYLVFKSRFVFSRGKDTS